MSRSWLNKINFIGRLADYFSRNSRKAKIVSLIIILLIIPITVAGALSIQHYKQYASESCTLRGDANGDGEVDIADVTYIERIILGLNKETVGSDADGDGKVDIADVTRTERIILGLEEKTYKCVKNPESPSSSSGSSSNSSNSSNNPGCGDLSPVGAPNLFQINVNSTTSTLYYTPLSSNVTDYYIFYGTKPGALQHSVNTKQGRSSGVLSYSINYLNPNSTYYFRIRGQNGCMPGEWSNEMKISTGPSGSKTTVIYYKNGASKSDVITTTSATISATTRAIPITPSAIPTISTTMEPLITNTPFVTQSPMPTPAPLKRTCFLWWCW